MERVTVFLRDTRGAVKRWCCDNEISVADAHGDPTSLPPKDFGRFFAEEGGFFEFDTLEDAMLAKLRFC